MAQERSKVAAATAAVVPFHCVVCFDEFSIKERPPVVLPCGHTYICLPCSKRIKRCMECREPLFYSIKSTTTSANMQQQHHQQHPRTPVPFAPNMYGRYSPTTPGTPPQHTGNGGSSSSSNTNSNSNTQSLPMMVQQIPCSIPKNVVLIAMMEAAERQARENSNNNNKLTPEATTKASKAEYVHDDDDTSTTTHDDDYDNDDDDDGGGSMNASEDDEEYDLNRIISGMATFSGPCGTYAVKEMEGLNVYPTLASLQEDDYERDQVVNDNDEDENDECGDQSTSRSKLNVTASYDSVEITDSDCCTTTTTIIQSNTNQISTQTPILKLRRGQTVQIVRFENGIATIARNGGYIRANSSQLVKVGGPLEKTCRLAGLLDTVINRGKDLQQELDESKRIEEAIRREIEAELLVEPIHPIITSIEDDTENRPNSSPTTPKATANGRKNHHDIEQPTLGTPPQGNVSSPLSSSGSVRKSSTDLCQYQIDPFPQSPNENHNNSNNMILGGNGTEFRAPGLPSYRTRPTSFDDEYYNVQDYGCGAANILGNSAFRLFTTSTTAASSTTTNGTPAIIHRQPLPTTASQENLSDDHIVTHTNSYTGNNRYQQQQQYNRFRSMSSDAHHNHHSNELGSASSFDAIDFRTGMSGHRGLNNKTSASKLNSNNQYHHHYHAGHHSPSSHYRSSNSGYNSNRFMMSEHRGIARVRGPLQKTVNTTP